MKNKKYLLLVTGVLLIFPSYFYLQHKTASNSAELKIFDEFVEKIVSGEVMIRDLLSKYSAEIAKERKSRNPVDIKKDYSMDGNGVFSNHAKTRLSNTYVGAGTAVTSDLIEFLDKTDALEPIWQQRPDHLKTLLPWQYTYHLSSNTIRMYPWINFSQIFGPKNSWSMVKYFKDAQMVKSVSGKPFCTRLYDDVGGTGLGFSCCQIESKNDEYNSSIALCVDLSIKDLLNEVRIKLASEKQCIDQILFHSTALPIAYTKDVLVDLRTGNNHKSDSFFDQIDSKKRIFIKRFDLLDVEVYLVKGCE